MLGDMTVCVKVNGLVKQFFAITDQFGIGLLAVCCQKHIVHAGSR